MSKKHPDVGISIATRTQKLYIKGNILPQFNTQFESPSKFEPHLRFTYITFIFLSQIESASKPTHVPHTENISTCVPSSSLSLASLPLPLRFPVPSGDLVPSSVRCAAKVPASSPAITAAGSTVIAALEQLATSSPPPVVYTADILLGNCKLN